MKKVLLTVVLAVSLVVLIIKYASYLPIALGIKETAGIRIQSEPEADVLINGQNVGKTPYERDNLAAEEVTIKLSAEAGSWEGKVKLGGRTITFISRDLAKDSLSEAGEILSLTKGSGVTVISSPGNSSVEVDGKVLGQTPGSFEISEGEHTFVISHGGFINRSIKASTTKNYNLKLVVDLAASEGESTFVTPSPPPTVDMVKVLSTPTGFLRVRDRASTAGKEISRVSPGDELQFLGTEGSWTKVKLPDSTEGFVSSQYVTKI